MLTHLLVVFFAQVLQQIDEQLSPTAALETALRGVFAGKAPSGLCYGSGSCIITACFDDFVGSCMAVE